MATSMDVSTGHEAGEANGDKMWRNENGELHREFDLPAIVRSNGTEEWWENGQRHREGDKPAIKSSVEMEWWENGQRHRGGDKPAIVRGVVITYKAWWVKGVLHRGCNKPAIIWSDGVEDFWENGEHVRRALAGASHWWAKGSPSGPVVEEFNPPLVTSASIEDERQIQVINDLAHAVISSDFRVQAAKLERDLAKRAESNMMKVRAIQSGSKQPVNWPLVLLSVWAVVSTALLVL